MSDTPETDQFQIKFKTICGEKYWVPVDIARKMEKEKNELKELSKELKSIIDYLHPNLLEEEDGYTQEKETLRKYQNIVDKGRVIL